MQIYKRRNILVHAEQLQESNAAELAMECGGMLVEEIDPFTNEKTPGINVPTQLGNIRASAGDYIVKNWMGQFSVEKPTKFEEEYERPTR